MAGTHRSSNPGEALVTLRLPAALKVHLQDEAERHHRSLNSEIVARLNRQRVRLHNSKRVRALMALEPQPDDPRSDLEISREMDLWWDG